MFDGWPKFIDNLCDIIKDKKEDLIHVSLRILSRICDLLVNFGHQIDRRKMGNDTQGILGSLLMCIEAEVANKEVRTTALKALRLAAEFIGECLDRQDAREYVFKLLLVNLNLPDQETVALTYQLMIELVKAMYIYLDDRFISEIAGLSKKHIESRSNSVVIFVCEFWSAFAGEETYRKENMEVVTIDNSLALTKEVKVKISCKNFITNLCHLSSSAFNCSSLKTTRLQILLFQLVFKPSLS